MTELMYSLKRAQPTTRRELKVQGCHICNNSLIVIPSCFQQEQIILEMFARLTLDPEITLRIRMREMRGIRVDDSPKFKNVTDGRTDGRTDQRTDGRTDKASYRVACPQLKTELWP